METQTFDTLTYVKRLQSGGLSRKQAEAQAEALIAVVNHNLATRTDIEKVRGEIKNREARTLLRLRELENRLTIRMGLMFGATITILAALITLPQLIQ